MRLRIVYAARYPDFRSNPGGHAGRQCGSVIIGRGRIVERGQFWVVGNHAGKERGTDTLAVSLDEPFDPNSSRHGVSER
jgi:hypothetical protein